MRMYPNRPARPQHPALWAAALPALAASIVLLLAAPLAQAQVAVPELVPAGVRLMNSRFPVPGSTISPIAPMSSIVPENPAAIQWGAPSRIGGGVIRGNMSDLADGRSDDYSGSMAGFRWVKQRVALAADTTGYSVDLTNPASIKTHVERKQQSVALSFSLPESLAWGVSSRSLTLRDAQGPATSSLDSRGWNAGVSWRLGQVFYLGAGVGQDSATAILPPAVPPKFDLKRDHRMAGIGLRGSGSVVWHLEVDSIHYDRFEDSAGIPRLPGYDLSLYVAEIQFGNWLFGYARHALKDLQGNFHVNGYTADFGFAPFNGIAFTARTELSRREDAAGMQLSDEHVTSGALLWQF